jgi:hypothetical protein
MGGDQSEGWLIPKSGDHIIGLFQGMFEKNSPPFNPGWQNVTLGIGAFGALVGRVALRPEDHLD